MHAGTDKIQIAMVVGAAALLCGCAPSEMSVADASETLQQAEVEQPVVKGELAQQIDTYLNRLSAYGYNFSLLVGRDDEVLLQKGYGFDTSSVFNIASVAKQFTATAILKLASEGKLKLSDPITVYFPEAPAQFSTVTIDHLLAHTSGIRDDYSVVSGFRSPQELTQHVFARPLASQPGAAWEYSNFGYSLLAVIIQRASGQPFKTYMRSELFEPAGLRSTGFVGDNAWSPRVRPAASGGTRPEGSQIDRWGFGLGGSDIVSSPADLFRWVRALRGDRILPDRWRGLLDHSVIPVFAGLGYGRGWWLREVELGGKKRLNIWHSGQEEVGFSAWLNRYPSEALVTVFLTSQAYEGQPLREFLNSAGGPSTLEKLIYGGDVYLPPQPVEAVDLHRFVGKYRIDEDNWFAVRATPPFLEVVPHGQAAFNALLPTRSGEKAPEAMSIATARTKEIFEGLRAGNRSALRRYRTSDEPIPEEFFSTFESFEILGSAPIRPIKDNGEGLLATYVLVKRSRDTQYWRVQWTDNEVDFIYRSTQPILPLFRATGASAFANFQPFIRGSAFLHFDDGGAVAGTVRARPD